MTSLGAELLETGEVFFTVESRIIREFGERLVKQPEVAILELVKNAHDADATECTIRHQPNVEISVVDTGLGMSLDEFKNGWMRIGTSSKATVAQTRRYGRPVSGEKGIGRFAVRYLGKQLDLETTAMDDARGHLTTLTASFHWPSFDKQEDLGRVSTVFRLERALPGATTGTSLRITQLRPAVEKLNLRSVLTAALGLVSPYAALLRRDKQGPKPPATDEPAQDPGFNLTIGPEDEQEQLSVAAEVLANFVLRCVLKLEGKRLRLDIYRRDDATNKPHLRIVDRYESALGDLYVDLRFFPIRKGTFKGLSVDGRRAREWVKEHSGVAVFDRNFRVYPYGDQGDDWLSLAVDNVRNQRTPVSSIANRHLVMDEETRKSTQLNYMLRLPYPYQLVGAVQVSGVRNEDVPENGVEGLLATADRQGFVNNAAFRSLVDVVRGAAEAMAFVDREVQQDADREEAELFAAVAKEQTRHAIEQITSNPDISSAAKSALVKSLVVAQTAAERSGDLVKARESALEVMSLLGVVAGFMTHEFGTALHHLSRSHALLVELSKRHPALEKSAVEIAERIDALKEFKQYSQGYVLGTSVVPEKALSAKPRILQVIRVFGKYAKDRGIDVAVDVEQEVQVPPVPLSLYGGIVLNLFTNALKAVTAKARSSKNEIAIRAWDERGHHFPQVSDTGIGVPTALAERVFDPLFTTTATNRDPLGSGMGLGLSLVRRGAKAFGGSVQLVDPPPGYATCFEVKFPRREET